MDQSERLRVEAGDVIGIHYLDDATHAVVPLEVTFASPTPRVSQDQLGFIHMEEVGDSTIREDHVIQDTSSVRWIPALQAVVVGNW